MNAASLRSVPLDRHPHAEVEKAMGAFCSKTGRAPRYVVLDRDTFLWFFQWARHPALGERNGECRIMGMTAVVIETDGLPMVQVTDWPMEQALRADGATSEASAS